jgi:hypothetical protein
VTDRRLVVLCAILAGCLAFSFGARSGAQPSAPGAAQDSGGGLMVSSALGATSALLFVVDPDTRTLAAYEAIPGQEGGLRLVGARKIDQDLRLTGYRDLSEYSHSEFKEQFEKGPSGGADEN